MPRFIVVACLAFAAACASTAASTPAQGDASQAAVDRIERQLEARASVLPVGTAPVRTANR